MYEYKASNSFFCFCRTRHFYRRCLDFCDGKTLKTIFFWAKSEGPREGAIETLERETAKLNKAKENIEKDIVVINAKLKKSIRGIETVRFNPFSDQGSNQSFAIGMLNEDGDGVVISSLYSREHMSVFAKPVKNNKSTYRTFRRRKEVLTKAKVS